MHMCKCAYNVYRQWHYIPSLIGHRSAQQILLQWSYIYISVKFCNSLINQQTNIPVLKKIIFPVMFSTSMIWEAYHVVCWRIVVSNTYCVVVFCLVYPMLPVSLDCPFLIAPSVFSNVYVEPFTTLIISPILYFILNSVLHFESTDACEMELHPLYITCFVHIFFFKSLYLHLFFLFISLSI